MSELSPAIIVETPEGRREYESFAAASEAGYPVGCQWFAGCEREAAEAVPHPILGHVPTCAKHAAWVADIYR